MKNTVFVTILIVLFTILKLTSVIDWAWIWVFSPVAFSFGIGFLRGFLNALIKNLK